MGAAATERPCRVALAIGSARRGGAEGQLIRFARELASRDVEVLVLFTAFAGPLTANLDEAGVRWRRVGRARERLPGDDRGGASRIAAAIERLGTMCRLARELLAFRPTVVYAWLPGAIWVTLPLAALLTRATLLAGIRGDVFPSEVRRIGPLFRIALSRSHWVTINAPSLFAEAIRWGAAPERVINIPNGVDQPPVVAVVERTPPTAVVVANFRHCKGHDVLLDALELVKRPLAVRLLGEGPLREPTRHAALARGLGDRITFVEPPADVVKELIGAQFAIHPSRTEGLPNAVLEELAAGLPIVATDVGATGLVVTDGVTGFLVPPENPERLAERIAELAASPKLRASMAGAARVTASRYTWDTCADRYLELFGVARASEAAVDGGGER